MRRNELTRHSRKTLWRKGVIGLALAGTAFATAIAAAAIGGDTGGTLTPERAVERTIVRQRIAEGLPAGAATPPAAAQPPAAQPAMTSDQILAAVDSYEGEMNTAVAQTEKLKAQAYQAKDIIRLNFIVAKLDEMKQVLAVVEPVIQSIRQPGLDLFVMQAKLSTIRQGAERIRNAASAAASAQGDGADEGGGGLDSINQGKDTNSGVTDPPGAPTAGIDSFGDRPANASPYR